MVAPELKLERGPPLPRIEVERAPEDEPRRFSVLSADIELTDTGGRSGDAVLQSHGKAKKPQ